MSNFWEQLPKPFFALAPMADVTDPAFRMIITKYSKYGGADIYDSHGKFIPQHSKIVGGPDVTWTEFVSADGLASKGREVLQRDLEYTEGERPIVAQLFSAHPDKMREASKFVASLGFDGIDINMGCPDRSIEKQGAGAAMIKTPDVAVAIIQAVKDGIADAGCDIPVSVKTRVGYNKIQIDEWIPLLLAQNISALTVHARTRKEMSLVPARWEHVKEVVALRDQMGVATKIIGNGDVKNIEHARALAEETGCDGVMIGRALFGNPWLFADTASSQGAVTPKTQSLFSRIKRIFFKDKDAHKYWLHAETTIPLEERLRVLIEHTKLYEELLGDIKSFSIMKKHYKAYVHGFDGAKELRMKLMEAENAREVEKVISAFLFPVA